MRAARLLPGATALTLTELPDPEPHGSAVRVQVLGAGVCRSDLHVLDGAFAEVVQRPVTPGHEIAGVVDAVPPGSPLEVGTPVVVMAGWGCGRCRTCAAGHEQLCPDGREAGSSADGGFAEYLLVPHARHLVPLGDLDPYAATPLGCAALSAYAALRRVQPQVAAGGWLLVIGAGALGLCAVHYAKTLTGARVVVVDRSAASLARARDCGADHTLTAGPDAAAEVLSLSEGQGCAAVLDFVGSDDSLGLAAATVAARGAVGLLGLAAGTLPYGFGTLAPEATLTTIVAGTLADLHDVVRLAHSDDLPLPLVRYALPQINEAVADLRAGRVPGRGVVVP